MAGAAVPVFISPSTSRPGRATLSCRTPAAFPAVRSYQARPATSQLSATSQECSTAAQLMLLLMLCTDVVVMLSPAGASTVMCWPLQTAAVEEWGEAAVQPAGMNAAAAGFGGVLLSVSPYRLQTEWSRARFRPGEAVPFSCQLSHCYAPRQLATWWTHHEGRISKQGFSHKVQNERNLSFLECCLCLVFGESAGPVLKMF